jgi:predicted metal-dependent peptidase
MLELAKIIRDTRDNIGAPAKTDFVKIYIDKDVSGKEYDVLLKHEQAHIWLEHNRRQSKGMKIDTWLKACELEIARNIYTIDDIDIIKAPFSTISGGFVPDTIPNLPHYIVLAEEIYEWLLNNKNEENALNKCKCCNNLDNNGEKEEKLSLEQVKSIIEYVKKEVESLQKSKIAEKNTVLKLQEIIKRKPSLISEVDAALRNRIVREKSYRRPSRKENENYIEKGRITISSPPLVEIFIDRSGSFTPAKTAMAQNSLEKILKRYNSSIKHDVWFFGGGKISAQDFSGGDTPYHLIAEHLKLTKPKIAIIVTDDDSCSEIKIDTKMLVIPIDCNTTDFAKKSGATEVSI